MLMMVDLLTLNWGLDIDMIMEEKTRTYCHRKITPDIEHHMSEKRTENFVKIFIFWKSIILYYV